MINWKRKNVTLIELMSSLLHYTLVQQINFINICLIIINRQELISAKFNKRLLAGSTSVKNHWNFSGVFLQCSIQYVHWIDSATCGKLRYLLECNKLLLIFWYLSMINHLISLIQRHYMYVKYLKMVPTLLQYVLYIFSHVIIKYFKIT